MNFRKFFLIIGFTLLISACGSGKTLVLEPTASGQGYASEFVTIIHEGDTVGVPEEVGRHFLEGLQESLFEEGSFTEGMGLKIKYRFIQFEPGSQFTRYMLGGLGNSGEASVTAEVEFYNSDDVFLSKIQVEGKIGSGVFGGSVASAVKKAAREAADYALTNFR